MSSLGRYGSGWHATPGDEVETVVYNRLPGLQFVPDTRAGWHDFRAVHRFAVGDELVREDIEQDAIPSGAPVELKSACLEQSNGSRMTAGRWWAARENHETLRQRGGYYLLVVYWPVAEEPLVALATASADRFDDLVSWCPTGTGSGSHRDECAKLGWSRVFEREAVFERSGGETA